MLGQIIYINTETNNFCIATKNGKGTICNVSNINDIKIGDYIEFENKFNCTNFYNSRTERISASVIYLDIDISRASEYCK
jgi:hypothetical protein